MPLGLDFGPCSEDPKGFCSMADGGKGQWTCRFVLLFIPLKSHFTLLSFPQISQWERLKPCRVKLCWSSVSRGRNSRLWSPGICGRGWEAAAGAVILALPLPAVTCSCVLAAASDREQQQRVVSLQQGTCLVELSELQNQPCACPFPAVQGQPQLLHPGCRNNTLSSSLSISREAIGVQNLFLWL